MTDLPAMRPSAEERVKRIQSPYYIWSVASADAISTVQEAYRDGVAAVLALLREPSSDLVNAVADDTRRNFTTLQDRARYLLSALADEIERSAQERKAPALGGGQDDAEA